MGYAKAILASGIVLLAACSGNSSSFNSPTSSTSRESRSVSTPAARNNAEKAALTLTRCPSTDRFLAVPPRYELSTSTDIVNGPLKAESLGELADRSSSAAKALHFVQGCEAYFDSTTQSEYFHVMLVQFASPADATFFTAMSVSPFALQQLPQQAAPVLSTFDGIPGASTIDETKPESDGTYTHAVIAARGSRVMLIEYVTPSPGDVPLMATIAKGQYALLPR